jgi:hypothetical protein
LSSNILQEVLLAKIASALWLKLESMWMSKDLTSKIRMNMICYLSQVARRCVSDESPIDL